MRFADWFEGGTAHPEPDTPPPAPDDAHDDDAALQPPATPVTLSPHRYSVTGVAGSQSPTTTTTTAALEGLRTGDWLEGQTFPEVQYAVPQLIPEGFTLLVGAPKAGKSWLVLDMALAVAAGGLVLGQRVTPRPVLYLALEDSDRRLRYRAKTLYSEGVLPPDWSYMLRIPPGHGAPDVIEAYLQRLPSAASPPLVIVDTLGKVRPGRRPSESVYEYDYRIGGRMKRLADDVPGSALVAVHHDRKAGAADFVDDVSGSNGLAGSADSIVILRRDRNSADGVLLVTGRDVTEGGYAARFDAGRWSLAGGGFAPAAAAYAQTAAVIGKGETSHRIVKYLADAGACSPKQVAEALGAPAGTIRTAMSRLAADGLLDRAGGLYFLPDWKPQSP